MVNLRGATALVTGASSGIGHAVALALARAGMKLCLTGRNQERLDAAAMAAEGAEDVLAHVADLTDDRQRDGLVRAVEEAFGDVAVLVHSAAVVALGTTEEASVDALADQLAANLSAPFLLTRRLLPGLIRSEGQIVFVNSSAGLAPSPGAAAYGASKHGLRGFADSLRGEVNPQGVRVLSIYPGRTATPMQESIMGQEGRDYLPELLLQPEDVAEMVLASLRLPRTAEVTDIQIRPMQKHP